MSSTAGDQSFFSHGKTTAEADRAHELLVDSPNWRRFSFHGVMVDPTKHEIFLMLGCPGCDSTMSKRTDITTAMDAITNGIGVGYRSLEMLTSILQTQPRRRRDEDLGHESSGVPIQISDAADVARKISVPVEKVAILTPGESIKCLCGHDSEDGVFFPCDGEGNYCEPTAECEWKGMLRCCHCRRYFNQETGIVLGLGQIEDDQELEATRDNPRSFGRAWVARVTRHILTVEADGGEVESRNGALWVRINQASEWKRACELGDHVIEIAHNGVVLIKRNNQVVFSVG